MVLSNAERQKRYRARLQAAAKGDDLGQRARETIDAALSAIWDWGVADGTYGDFVDFASKEEWLASTADPRNADKRGVAGTLAMVLEAYREDVPAEARPLIDRAAAIVSAVMLEHVAQPKTAKTARATR